jgi:exodeoxyribonuclease VII small subunit
MTARRGAGAARRGRKAQNGAGGSDGESEEPEAPSFEVGLERLEAIVDQLEQGELPLEEALTAFEQGVRLTQQCASQLDSAERRIDELTRESGEWVARPFEAQEIGSEPEDEEEG